MIDAKSPDERIEDYTYQGAGYALQVNRKHKDRPLRYYMLTNVYEWVVPGEHVATRSSLGRG